MRKFFGKTSIDFQGRRRVAMTLSGLAILVGLISLILHGGPNYSIDFEGGLSILLRFNAPEDKPAITEDVVRASLGKIELGESEVKMSRSEEGEDLLIRIKEEGRYRPPEALIRSRLEQQIGDAEWRIVPGEMLDVESRPELRGLSWVAITGDLSGETLQAVLDSAKVDNPKLLQHKDAEGEPVWILAGEGRDAVSRLRNVLANDYPDYPFEIRSIDRVGPRIGAELRIKALFAIFSALGLIVIYLWWRFELLFGIAAVVALFHDVLITLGLFSLLNLEISIIVIGAFLTLVGYSLNDTIVVFDRIRENLKRYRDMGYAELINLSINETLSRTIITGLTTLLVVVILFTNGGPVLHGFSLALIAGIIVGTYSSIYIASPILIEWAERSKSAPGGKLRRKR